MVPTSGHDDDDDCWESGRCVIVGGRRGEDGWREGDSSTLSSTQFNLFNPLTSCFEATRLSSRHGGRARANRPHFLGSANFWWPPVTINQASYLTLLSKGESFLLDAK
jgi:hypothetical protein